MFTKKCIYELKKFKFNYKNSLVSNVLKEHLLKPKMSFLSITNRTSLYKINKFNFVENPKNQFSSPRNQPDELRNQVGPKYQDIEKEQKVYDSDSEDPMSFKNERKRLFYLLTASAIIITGVYIGLSYLKPDEKIASKRRLGEVTYVGKAQIGGPWKLLDTNGQLVTHKDLQGKYYLIYFGFTQCPDVCPMSLQKLAQVLTKIRQSKEYKYFDLECLFISVDPDRDSFERIKQYCSLFDNKILGLTAKSNDDKDLKDMLKHFKIHSSKIYLSKEDEEEDKKNMQKNAPEVLNQMDKLQPKINSKYSLDHTIVTYLMGPNNNFLTYLSSNLNSQEMYNIVLDEIMNDLTSQLKSLPTEKNKH
jgi:protein SCO1/2